MNHETGPSINQEKLEALREQVVQALEERAGPEKAVRNSYFHKAQSFSAYGLSTPELRVIMRRFKPAFKQLTLSERLALSEVLFQTSNEELAHIATYLLALSVSDLNPDHLDEIDRFLDHFRTWSVTDDFGSGVLQPLLLRYPQAVLPLLEKWNRSENRWKRRASMVTFTRKVGASGQFTDTVLDLCENLIWDPEDLVQKAVGWALKDNLRGAKESVLAYVKDLRRRGVSSTITLYAIRDLRGEERAAILAIKPASPDSTGVANSEKTSL